MYEIDLRSSSAGQFSVSADSCGNKEKSGNKKHRVDHHFFTLSIFKLIGFPHQRCFCCLFMYKVYHPDHHRMRTEEFSAIHIQLEKIAGAFS